MGLPLVLQKVSEEELRYAGIGNKEEYMRYISTETQRKIMFVPIINIMTLAFCLNNTVHVKADMMLVMRIFPYLFGYAGLPGLLWVLFVGFLPTVANIMYPIVMYLWPLCLSYGAIRYQEKYIDPLHN